MNLRQAVATPPSATLKSSIHEQQLQPPPTTTMTRFMFTAALTCMVFACVTTASALRHQPPDQGVDPRFEAEEALVGSDSASFTHHHLRRQSASRTSSRMLGDADHRQLARFIPNEYNEFAHLAEYLSVSIGAANTAAEEKAEKDKEEAERARANGLVFSTDSSSVEDREAEARRKALRAYGIGTSGSGSTTVETTKPPTKPPTQAEQKKALLSSIGW